MATSRVILPLALAFALSAAPGLAQVKPTVSAASAPLTGLFVTTPTPEFSVPLEDSVSVPISLRNIGLPPQRVKFEITGLPEDWSWTLRPDSGATSVSAAIVAPDATETLTLDINPAEGTGFGSYEFELLARNEEGTTTLPMSVTFSEVESGGVDLEAELPALRGAPNSTFTYRMDLTNNSGEDALFNLTAETPPGFTATFKRGFGSEQITGIPVAARSSERITLELRPASGVPAGTYPARVDVVSGELSASVDLQAEVTGTPDVRIVGPNERLSGNANAGATTNFPFLIANTGSAPAEELRLSGSGPSGWTVEITPETPGPLAAGATQEIDVAITPSEQAVAGDYMVTVRASGGGISESVQFRVTVQTSTVWGIVGVAVIAIAVLVLVLAVLRYGRR
ncbi:NEW3 domain-containing protein [Pelagibacterium halotolerans]|uniref:COG1470 family protein n=1 Tax=Pelagibacterium halotolerans TaxID=531813 RepID=UPI00384DC207